VTAGVPLYFLLATPNVIVSASGTATAPSPVWRTFWELFGASNQLLAALTLLGVTVWLWRTRRAWWVWIVTGLPTAFMYVMSTWALLSMTIPQANQMRIEFLAATSLRERLAALADPLPWVGMVLIALAALMLIEAIRILASLGTPPEAKGEPAVAAAAGA